MQEYTNEWLYRQIVDETQNAIIFANRDGQIEGVFIGITHSPVNRALPG